MRFEYATQDFLETKESKGSITVNTHLKQLWAAMKLPETEKSYKFFCRGLDIRDRV